MDGFTIGSFLASFLASAAHGGNLPIISKIYKFFPKKDNLINHDLQKAVKRSYLSAIQNIAMDCQKELEKDKSFLDRMLSRSDDLNWLKQKRNQTAKALGQLDKEKSVEIPLETLRQIESLFSPSGKVVEEITQLAKEKLTTEALKDERIPECYARAVEEKLFDLTCLYFAWEIKHTPEVRHIFQTQLLTQIDATGADTLQRLQNMEDLLLRLCNMFGLQQVPDVTWMLKINLSIQDVMEQLPNVAEKLKQHSKDGSLRVARIEGESNIVLVFEGSKQGFEQIRSLFQSSQLTQMLEIPVAGVEMETVVDTGIIQKPVHIISRIMEGKDRQLQWKLETLERQETSLKKQEDLLNKKLAYLQESYRIKADDAHKFQVRKEIEGVEKELEEVENKLGEIYRQMENL